MGEHCDADASNETAFSENFFAQLIEEHGGVEKIKELQSFSDPTVCDKAHSIISEHYSAKLKKWFYQSEETAVFSKRLHCSCQESPRLG